MILQQNTSGQSSFTNECEHIFIENNKDHNFMMIDTPCDRNYTYVHGSQNTVVE